MNSTSLNRAQQIILIFYFIKYKIFPIFFWDEPNAYIFKKASHKITTVFPLLCSSQNVSEKYKFFNIIPFKLIHTLISFTKINYVIHFIKPIMWWCWEAFSPFASKTILSLFNHSYDFWNKLPSLINFSSSFFSLSLIQQI